MRRTARLTLALLILSAAIPALAANPADLLAKLKDSLSKTSDFSARFTQTTTLEAAGMEKEAAGSVVFKKGAKMRWEYEGADPQVIVCDGKTVWVHQVRDRTVIKRELSEMTPAARAALDLLGGVFQVEKHFNLSSCGPSCVQLKPLVRDPDLAAVNLELSEDRSSISALVTEDSVGNKTRIALTSIAKNTGAPDSFFTFTPPKGVDVFDGEGRPQ